MTGPETYHARRWWGLRRTLTAPTADPPHTPAPDTVPCGLTMPNNMVTDRLVEVVRQLDAMRADDAELAFLRRRYPLPGLDTRPIGMPPQRLVLHWPR